MSFRRSVVPVALSLALLAAACSDDGNSASESSASTSAVETTVAETVAPLAPATFTVQPGSNQVAVLDADVGTTLAVYRDGESLAEGTVDEQGSLLFRELKPGTYTIRSAEATSDEFEVADAGDVPDPSIYSPEQQTLLPADGGFGYIITRDGTTLSANVILPGPAADGPYPTVVEYSGYQPSDPDSADLAALYTAQGLAYVGVNMRGMGCSGGSFRFFETVQSLDGYDAIEAIAAQPWVLDHEVGMVGISYPGISQLFVAATQPPSLNSITPLSVLDDSYRSTLYPGGILNTGFAVSWTQERVDQSKPFGQEWTKARADAGDTMCADNQKLRLQNPDLVQEIDDNPFYANPLGDSLAPATFVDRIEVPVFLAGAWQDEQTGGHFPAMLPNFTGSPHVYVTLTNGLHTESLSPPVARRYMEFLQLYVGKNVPDLSAGTLIAAALGGAIWGVDEFGPFENRFTGMTYADALAAFEAEKPVRILFEQGGDPAFAPGTPEPHFTAEFDQWPVPSAVNTLWGLGDGGSLVAGQQGTGTTPATYTADPSALPTTFYTGGGNGVWRADVQYDWQPLPDGTGVGFVTPPFDADTVVVGPGSVDLWIASDAADTDLEVTISEVRPDGTEIYVQSGWLRASQRALDEAASTDLRPVHTHAEADATDLPTDGSFTGVRVELFPFAHPFRAGSRLRLTVDAPGNNRAIWEFRTISKGEQVQIATDSEHPSRLVLSTVPNVPVPADAPPACGSVRGQPCRPYQPAGNGG
ncbi:MAG: CocE/NonD family hydrolase [Actinobacteria bacterium]|nr:CocE/NonD family hydrolase [Actinomycetota bacterium]